MAAVIIEYTWDKNLRERLNHFNISSKVPDTAFPVISRNRILSSSSIDVSGKKPVDPFTPWALLNGYKKSDSV